MKYFEFTKLSQVSVLFYFSASKVHLQMLKTIVALNETLKYEIIFIVILTSSLRLLELRSWRTYIYISAKRLIEETANSSG